MPTRAVLAALLALALVPAAADARQPRRARAQKRQAETPRGPLPSRVAPTEYTYEVVARHPHDRDAFTQGLVYRNGKLFESTGLRGRSSLREVDLETGAVLRRVDVEPPHFAEGLAELGGRLYQLTWQSRLGFVYDATSFAPTGEFPYEGEGWGLTDDGRSLVMSDGTSVIRFLDPATFAVRRTITVTDEGVPVTNLNELEYIRGEIYANVWHTDTILRIHPRTGQVTGVIDMAGLLPPDGTPVDVLNGIAYDADGGRIFVTGKLWPALFEVRFVRKR
jgi:glutamine cyclotransferase